MSDYDQNIPHGTDPESAPPEGEERSRRGEQSRQNQEHEQYQQYQQYQQAPPPPRGGFSTIPPNQKSVGAAAILSCMPGIGQTYAGFPRRGIQIALTIAALIMILNVPGLYALHPFVGLMLAFTWIFNIIDAARCARVHNQRASGEPDAEIGPELPLPFRFGGRGSGIFLVGLGTFLLLVTLFDFSLEFLEDWWPVGLIGAGVWMILRDRESDGASSET